MPYSVNPRAVKHGTGFSSPGMNNPAASPGVSSFLLGRHSVLDTESSPVLWIPAFAGMTNSPQQAGNVALRESKHGDPNQSLHEEYTISASIFKRNAEGPYLPIMDGRYSAIPGKMVMRIVTASMANKKGKAPRKIVAMGTSFATPARV